MTHAIRKISNRPSAATASRIVALAVLDLRIARRIADLDPRTVTALDLHVLVTAEVSRAQLRAPKVNVSVAAAEARAANYLTVAPYAPAIAEGAAASYNHLRPCDPIEDGRAIAEQFISYLADVTDRAANDVRTTNATRDLVDLIAVAEHEAKACRLTETWKIADHVEETVRAHIVARFSPAGYPHYLTVAVLPYVLATHATRTYDAPCIRCDAQSALLAADAAGDHARAEQLRAALMNGSDDDVYTALFGG